MKRSDDGSDKLGRNANPSFPRNRPCQTLTSGHERPIRHSRESGNPGVVEGCYSGVSPLHPAWIPAFAGMTDWGAGMTDWGAGAGTMQRVETS